MRKGISALVALATGATLALGAGSAVAAPVDAYAPHATAAAEVAANGDLVKTKYVDYVGHPSTGLYCVHVSQSWIDVDRSVPSAILRDYSSHGGSIRVETTPNSACGGAAQTLTVVTYDNSGNHVDTGFYITLP
ncbi:hypothetical protein [Saccharothrix sp. ST-888]|uniref:hypothetical protein n=1 Tax=Saccharothrix sp. ST-888 TaxID=1427391 RepID=UPI0005EC8260|nr:hypothetical protein [Saccharothrix sp. ST-888]KJK58589.1 hypothetical protein UK12_09540 [Saccharothrix sp. ST-888]